MRVIVSPGDTEPVAIAPSIKFLAASLALMSALDPATAPPAPIQRLPGFGTGLLTAGTFPGKLINVRSDKVVAGINHGTVRTKFGYKSQLAADKN